MKLDETNNGVWESPPGHVPILASLSLVGRPLVLVGAVHGCAPVILDHGAPIREVGNVVNRASAPLIRDPSIQGPHHSGGHDPLGLDPCRPARVRPGRAAAGKPDCPLSSVNPGEDWEGGQGDDLPITGP